MILHQVIVEFINIVALVGNLTLDLSIISYETDNTSCPDADEYLSAEPQQKHCFP